MLSAILLGLGLAMDAAAVSICNGLKYQNYRFSKMLTSSLVFGIFQGIMPLIGYFIILPFMSYVEKLDHWLVFGVLAILGIRMIKEGMAKEEDDCGCAEAFSLKILLSEAVATSIDALSVGVSLPLLAISPYLACVLIGLTTFMICLLAHLLGQKLGLFLKDKAVIFGGIILILIGLKTLIEHLLA